jgi:hypothetical protein
LSFSSFCSDVAIVPLQFENVYAIGLKERTDRRDFLNLAASLVGFRVEWIDGVRGEDIIPKALPEVNYNTFATLGGSRLMLSSVSVLIVTR